MKPLILVRLDHRSVTRRCTGATSFILSGSCTQRSFCYPHEEMRGINDHLSEFKALHRAGGSFPPESGSYNYDNARIASNYIGLQTTSRLMSVLLSRKQCLVLGPQFIGAISAASTSNKSVTVSHRHVMPIPTPICEERFLLK